LRSLQTVHRVTDAEIDVEAGANWRSVLALTMQRGAAPPVLLYCA
jgi:hypothetical protein